MNVSTLTLGFHMLLIIFFVHLSITFQRYKAALGDSPVIFPFKYDLTLLESGYILYPRSLVHLYIVNIL